MKKILLILLILIMPIALANNEYGKVTSGGDLLITDVDVKVDDLTSRNLDYGEEITKKAKPGSKITFNVEALNNNTHTDMEDLEMIVIVDDLDLEGGTNEVDLDATKDKTLTVELTLPSDTDDRDYDVIIEVEAKLNNTVHRVEYDLDLVVEEEEEEEETPATYTSRLETMNESLHKKLDDLQAEIGSYFEPYQTCTSDLNTCNLDKETKDITIADLQPYKEKFETCDTDRTTLRTDVSRLQTKYNNCTGEIATVYEPRAVKGKNNGIIGFILGAVLVGAGWVIKEKKWKPQHEAEEEDVDTQ